MSELGNLIQQRDIYILNGNDEQADRIQNIIDKKVETKSYSLKPIEASENGKTNQTIVEKNVLS